MNISDDILVYGNCKTSHDENLKAVLTQFITIQETKLTPKAKTSKIHNFTTVCTDRLHKAGE